MLLSRGVLPDFAILSFSMCCISFVERFFLVSSIVWDQWGVTISHSINTAHLVVAKMGPRFARSTSTSTRQFKICCGGGRIFFQVG
jgi:hypothetical protein